MAGQELDSGLLKVGIEVAAFLLSFGGLIGYVRSKLKQVDKHEVRLDNIESEMSRGVRPQDISVLRDDIREIRKLIIESKK